VLILLFFVRQREHYKEYVDEVRNPLGRLIWILFTVLGILFFSVGCMMIVRLKKYFRDFYKEFGCQLWTANVLLTLPLTFRAITDAANESQRFQDLYYKNYYTLAIYNMILFVLATYIPMLTQISSLIFGFVRHKKVKLFRSFRDGPDGERPSNKSGNNADSENQN